jgi:hypothetical protein
LGAKTFFLLPESSRCLDCGHSNFFASGVIWITHTQSQGCQMVYFQTKNPNLGKFLRILQLKIMVCTFYGGLVNFPAICYIFTVLVYCATKDLATLTQSGFVSGFGARNEWIPLSSNTIFHKFFLSCLRILSSRFLAGLPDFSWYNIPPHWVKYTKWQKHIHTYIPIGHKINKHLRFARPSQIYPNLDF